jgi:nucleoside-diphosphate-sugar epimerase
MATQALHLANVPVLLTGGSGFVGRYLAVRLAAAGARVSALVRRPGESPVLSSPGITQIEGDFTDPGTARRACAGMALVVHSAASISGDLDEARRVNVAATAVLAAAARAAECRHFLHISTVSVYDWECGLEVFDESAPLKSGVREYAYSPAASPFYGLSKAEGEVALAAEMANGLPATIFRLGAVLGVHPTSSWAVLVPQKIRAGQVATTGDGGSPLPWTHVANVAHAVERALLTLASQGRAYNVVDGHVTWRHYVDEVRSWFPDAPPAAWSAGSGARSFVGCCPNDRIRSELAYQSLRGYEEGMAEAAAWWGVKLPPAKETASPSAPGRARRR